MSAHFMSVTRLPLDTSLYCLELKTAFTHPPRGHICSSLQYLSLLQGDLALFLAADECPVTPEDLVTSPQLMSKGCWEESDPVLNYTLKKGVIKQQDMRGFKLDMITSKP